MTRRRRRRARSLILELGLLAALIAGFYLLVVSEVGQDLALRFGELVAERMTGRTPSP